MADQDHDGSHIKGLIINMIHCFWPKLLQVEGFISTFNTPLVKAKRGKEVKEFYSMLDYLAWTSSSSSSSLKGNRGGAKKWNVKYYKGLGTSTADEAREY